MAKVRTMPTCKLVINKKEEYTLSRTGLTIKSHYALNTKFITEYLSPEKKPVELMAIDKEIIEGFGGKRALGVLRKSELCLNCSKLRMQFCLGVFNNVLYVFLLKFALFSKYYICKNTVFCCHVST